MYPLFIDYSTVSFILYFTKSTLTVLDNHDNTHACIYYINRDRKVQYLYEKPGSLLSSRYVDKKFVNNQLNVIWCF